VMMIEMSSCFGFVFDAKRGPRMEENDK
jgi:hypothetical protein